MIKLFLTLIVLRAITSVNLLAFGSLKSQSVNGFARYCYYTDGGALTVGSTDLCPISNSKEQNKGTPTITIQNRNVGFGSLQNQKVDGFNRYCNYSDGATLTVGSTDLCPISDK